MQIKLIYIILSGKFGFCVEMVGCFDNDIVVLKIFIWCEYDIDVIQIFQVYLVMDNIVIIVVGLNWVDEWKLECFVCGLVKQVVRYKWCLIELC